MARELTLAEVRDSRRFAWHPHGYLLVDGDLFSTVRMEPPAARGYSHALRVRRSSLLGAEHLVEDGWYHAEDCPCSLCAVSGDALFAPVLALSKDAALAPLVSAMLPAPLGR
jgi:hypothetical protein